MNLSTDVETAPSVLPAPGTISLARGIPAPDMFPVDQLARCSARAIQRHGRVVLNYGEPQGFRPLREWLADLHRVDPGRLLVTPGSIMSLTFVVRALLDTGGGIAAVQAPCYDRMLSLLGRMRAELLPIWQTGDGELDLAGLSDAVSRGRAPAFLYVLPTFNNPTGLTMSLQAREALVELAVDHRLIVVEDDPYGLLRVEGEDLPSLHELLARRGASDLAVYVSSFSKTVSPGLRVGYVVAPEALTERLRRAATEAYVSPPLLAQAQLYEYLHAGGFREHVGFLRGFLRARRDALLDALDESMPTGVSWTRPEGGYFMWLQLPQTVDAVALAQLSAAAGVMIVPGPGFFPDRGGEHAARLAFSFAPTGDLRRAAATLAELVDRLSG